MTDNNTAVGDLKEHIKSFVKARKWKKAHSPKNLSMSLAIEAAELMEHFQWISERESRGKFKAEQMEEIKGELADVAIYLFDLCDVLRVDLSDAVRNKMIKNAKKYPINNSNLT